MPSQYLEADEVATYGCTGANTKEITQASLYLDAYLKRPEGLAWVPDAQGLPCYMAGLSPTFEFTLTEAIQPGNAVPVTLDGPVGALTVGDVLVLDQGNEEACEACVIGSTTGPANQTALTFQTVVNAHAADATAQFGLIIQEKKYQPAGRPLIKASRTPLMRIVSGVGRYAFGRRGSAENYNLGTFDLLASITQFGGPPVWELWPAPQSNNWDPTTGQIWVPAGVLIAYYSEVRVQYVAGFPQSGIPPMVKMACAQIIKAIRAQPGAGNVKSQKAGDTSLTYFTASALDPDVRAALRPFMARAYG